MHRPEQPRPAADGGKRAPRVSVIVPVYNRVEYIADSVRSALAQSFGDLEVIVIDDGSTDGSLARVEAIGDPRIRCQRQTNSGRPAVARNAGIRLARGEYIAFLDSDDLWLPDKLRTQVQRMDARPDAGLCYGVAACFDAWGDLGQHGPKGARVPELIFESLLLDGCFVQTVTVMVRRAVLDAIGLFDEDPALRAVEDYELFLRIARRYAALFIPRVIARYRVHAGNISSDGCEMLAKVQFVVERSCELYEVEPALRARALASCHIERFKLGLEQQASSAELRRELSGALALDPHNRVAHAARTLLALGLLTPLRHAYRNRRYALRGRALLQQLLAHVTR